MQPLPPHLPKKEVKETPSSLGRSLFYFISFTFISIAASLATVFVALSWVVPRAVPEVRFYTFEHESQQQEKEILDAAVLERMKDREVKLYDKTKTLDGKWYPLESFLSTGVFLTSDGWAVFPTLATLDKKNIDIVDNRGLIYAVEEMFVSESLGLTYIKVGGEGFRFVSFASWDSILPTTDVLSQNNGVYEEMNLGAIVRNPNIAVREDLWKPHFVYTVPADRAIGPVFSFQGELFGLVMEDHSFLPGWYIDQSLLSLLSKHRLNFSVLGVKGEVVERKETSGMSKDAVGFFVTEFTGDKTKSDIMPGDVIVQMNGKDFTEVTMSRVLLESPEIVELQISRAGKMIERSLQKESIILN